MSHPSYTIYKQNMSLEWLCTDVGFASFVEILLDKHTTDRHAKEDLYYSIAILPTRLFFTRTSKNLQPHKHSVFMHSALDSFYRLLSVSSILSLSANFHPTVTHSGHHKLQMQTTFRNIIRIPQLRTRYCKIRSQSPESETVSRTNERWIP